MGLRRPWLHLPQSLLGERGLSRPSSHASSRCRSRNSGVLTKTAHLSSRNAPLSEAAVAPKAAIRYPRRYATRKRRRGGTRSPRVPGEEGGPSRQQLPPAPRAPSPPADAGWRPRYEQLTRREQVGAVFPEHGVSPSPSARVPRARRSVFNAVARSATPRTAVTLVCPTTVKGPHKCVLVRRFSTGGGKCD